MNAAGLTWLEKSESLNDYYVAHWENIIQKSPKQQRSIISILVIGRCEFFYKFVFLTSIIKKFQ